MLFLHLTDEFSNVRTGFNFYRLSDPTSFGFKFKAFKFYLIVRYAKMRKTHKWVIEAKTWSGTEWIEELQTNALTNLKTYTLV